MEISCRRGNICTPARRSNSLGSSFNGYCYIVVHISNCDNMPRVKLGLKAVDNSGNLKIQINMFVSFHKISMLRLFSMYGSNVLHCHRGKNSELEYFKWDFVKYNNFFRLLLNGRLCGLVSALTKSIFIGLFLVECYSNSKLIAPSEKNTYNKLTACFYLSWVINWCQMQSNVV